VPQPHDEPEHGQIHQQPQRSHHASQQPLEQSTLK
jgi:hypothetical protein